MLRITQRAIEALHQIADGRIVHITLSKRKNESLAEKDQDQPILAIDLNSVKLSGYSDYDHVICFFTEDPLFLEHHTIDVAYAPYGKVPRIILR